MWELVVLLIRLLFNSVTLVLPGGLGLGKQSRSCSNTGLSFQPPPSCHSIGECDKHRNTPRVWAFEQHYRLCFLPGKLLQIKWNKIQPIILCNVLDGNHDFNTWCINKVEVKWKIPGNVPLLTKVIAPMTMSVIEWHWHCFKLYIIVICDSL